MLTQNEGQGTAPLSIPERPAFARRGHNLASLPQRKPVIKLSAMFHLCAATCHKVPPAVGAKSLRHLLEASSTTQDS